MAKAKNDATLVTARLLVDSYVGKCDDLVEGEASVIAALVEAGLADDNSDAVEFKKKGGAIAVKLKATQDAITADPSVDQ